MPGHDEGHRTNTQTPVHGVNEHKGQRFRRVTIQEPEPEIAPSRLRQSGTMRLRSAPPETRSSSWEENEIITKPQGEPGRPNAGGHNVEAELMKQHWTKTQYNALY
ncbi:hypothetical protein C0993_012732, partial [Termitomyces sp. T159_Od127]